MIGDLRSGAYSPQFDKVVGIAMINKDFCTVGQQFNVKYNEKVDLLTIRHYNSLDIPDFLKSKEIVIQQRSRSTIRFVFKDKK